MPSFKNQEGQQSVGDDAPTALVNVATGQIASKVTGSVRFKGAKKNEINSKTSGTETAIDFLNL
jgi:hypothetical protein